MFLHDENEWLECGAFCVKFFNHGKEDIVIIDDYFPWLDDDYPYVSSSDKLELWPMIIEKAYAKKFGSYSLIGSGGFTHYALADLTNGFPELIQFDESTNFKKLFDQMYDLQEDEIRFGASSNSHPEGDAKNSDKGIVQGHAYSVLKFVKVDDL